eukprot:TRINITY_DN11072_c0_g1_i1.p1 TRINITY_DN11072_c0_g1~~TRINITY_DN11072_c0_g1_i1.p1  ORF type:complete len:2125 (+),score=494.96 TRINITY_DN11072_c0_g1_i1:74-6448(+)
MLGVAVSAAVGSLFGAHALPREQRISVHLRRDGGRVDVECRRTRFPCETAGAETAAVPTGVCPNCYRVTYATGTRGDIDAVAGGVPDPWTTSPGHESCQGPPPREQPDFSGLLPRRRVPRRALAATSELPQGEPRLWWPDPTFLLPVTVPHTAVQLTILSPRPCGAPAGSPTVAGLGCRTTVHLIPVPRGRPPAAETDPGPPPPPAPEARRASSTGGVNATTHYLAVGASCAGGGYSVETFAECSEAASELKLVSADKLKEVVVTAPVGGVDVTVDATLEVTGANETGPAGLLGVRERWRLSSVNGVAVYTTQDIKNAITQGAQQYGFLPPAAVPGSWPGRPTGCYQSGGATVYWNPSGVGEGNGDGPPARVICRKLPQVGELKCDAYPDTNTTTIQRVGPDHEHYNLVFLSAGYTERQRDLFRADVDEAVKLLQLPPVEGYRRTVPHSRFFPLLNVHAVFQPSAVQGAYQGNNVQCGTIPGIADALQCNMFLALEIANCAPCGTKGKRNVLTVVFINDERYGGAATRNDDQFMKVGVFSTRWWTEHPRDKRQFSSLFYHELAHAWFFLYDEYDIAKRTGGYAPRQLYPYPIPNCGPETEFGNPPWVDWIRDANGNDAYRNVLAVPHDPCGLKEYGKPSRDCMMEKLDSQRMCPVCREKGVIEMYKLGGPRPTEKRNGVKATTMVMAAPTCPTPDSIAVIAAAGSGVSPNVPSSVVLYGNDRFLTNTDVHVTWSVTPEAPGSIPSGHGEPVLEVQAAPLTPGVLYSFTMHTEDRTDWIQRDADTEGWWSALAAKYPDVIGGIAEGCDAQARLGVRRNCDRPTLYNKQDLEQWLVQKRDFRVLVAPIPADHELAAAFAEASNSPPLRVSGDHFHFDLRPEHPGTYMVLSCEASDGCDCGSRYVHAPYEVPHSYGSELALLEEKQDMAIFGGALGLLLVAKGLSYWASVRYGKRGRPIVASNWLEYTEGCRRLVLGSHTFLVLVGGAAFCAGAAIYQKVDAIFGVLIIMFGCLGFGTLLVSGLGFIAAWYRIKRLLILDFVLILCFFIASTFLLAAIIGYRVSDGDREAPFQKMMQSLWQMRVDKSTQGTCTLQKTFECSGWWENCSYAKGRDDCPEFCEGTNYWFKEPCAAAIQSSFNSNFTPILLVILFFWLNVGVSTVTTLVFVHGQRRVRAEVKSQQKVKVKSKVWSPLVDKVQEVRAARTSRVGGAVLATLDVFMPQKLEKDTRPRKWNYTDLGFAVAVLVISGASLVTGWDTVDGKTARLFDLRATGDHLQASAALYSLLCLCGMYIAVATVAMWFLMFGRHRFVGGRVRLAKKMLRPVTLASIAVCVAAPLTIVTNHSRSGGDCGDVHDTTVLATGEFGNASRSEPDDMNQELVDGCYHAHLGLPMAVLAFVVTTLHAAVHAMQDQASYLLGNKNLHEAPVVHAETKVWREEPTPVIKVTKHMIVRAVKGKPAGVSEREATDFRGWTLTHLDGVVVTKSDEIADGLAGGKSVKPSKKVTLRFERFVRPHGWAAANVLLCLPAILCTLVAASTDWVEIKTLPQSVNGSALATTATTTHLVTMSELQSGLCRSKYTGLPELLASLSHAGIAPGLTQTQAAQEACPSFFLAYVEVALLYAVVVNLALWLVVVAVLAYGRKGGFYSAPGTELRNLRFEGSWYTVSRYLPRPSGVLALAAMIVPVVLLSQVESKVDDACEDNGGTLYCTRKWSGGPDWCVMSGLLTWIHWWVHDFQDRSCRKGSSATALKKRKASRRPQRPKVVMEASIGGSGFSPEQLMSLYEEWILADEDGEGLTPWDFRQFWHSTLWMDLSDSDVADIFDFFAIDEPGRLHWHELEAALEDGALRLDETGLRLRRLTARGFARLEHNRGGELDDSPFGGRAQEDDTGFSFCSSGLNSPGRAELLDALLADDVEARSSKQPLVARAAALDALLDGERRGSGSSRRTSFVNPSFAAHARQPTGATMDMARCFTGASQVSTTSRQRTSDGPNRSEPKQPEWLSFQPEDDGPGTVLADILDKTLEATVPVFADAPGSPSVRSPPVPSKPQESLSPRSPPVPPTGRARRAESGRALKAAVSNPLAANTPGNATFSTPPRRRNRLSAATPLTKLQAGPTPAFDEGEV